MKISDLKIGALVKAKDWFYSTGKRVTEIDKAKKIYKGDILLVLSSVELTPNPARTFFITFYSSKLGIISCFFSVAQANHWLVKV